MNHRLCYSCRYFVDDIKTPNERKPKHCIHPKLSAFVGLSAGGFISGCDIFHCDYFEQYHWNCGDVYYQTEEGGILSYVKTRERKEKQQFTLTDNSQNIKPLYENKRKSLEKNHSRDYRDTFGSSWCPF